MSDKKDHKEPAKFLAKKLGNGGALQIKPIQQKGGGAKPAKGAEIFEEPYANVGVLAKKKSGKTTVIKHIIERCATKDTTVLVFCSSFHKDKSWLAIQEWCDDHEIPIEGFTSLIVDGSNKLEEELGDLKAEPSKDEKKKKVPEPKQYIEVDEEFGFVEVQKAPEAAPAVRKRQSKFAPLDYIFVFDDLGDELRDKTVAQLLKTNRHWKAKVIVSTQYITDLAPASRRQFDYWLLFSKLSPKNLNMVRESAGLDLEEDEFVNLYNQATKRPYDFLYIDTRDMTYRCKFDTALAPAAAQ